MSNINEIIGNTALFVGAMSFFGICLWIIYYLSKDDKKNTHKHKKA